MSGFTDLLHGGAPSPAGLALTYGPGIGAPVAAWSSGPSGLASILFALFALAWAGGVVANSTGSTRRYWAGLPAWASWAFLLVHLALFPPVVLWLAAGHPPLQAALTALLAAKLAVFAVGQAERRPASKGQMT